MRAAAVPVWPGLPSVHGEPVLCPPAAPTRRAPGGGNHVPPSKDHGEHATLGGRRPMACARQVVTLHSHKDGGYPVSGHHDQALER